MTITRYECPPNQSRLLLETESVRIEHFFLSEGENTKVAFVFSALGSKVLNGNVNGGDFLLENGFDVINFISRKNDWYQNVPEHIFTSISTLCTERGYLERAAMGSSMGGYAAICFSGCLNCDIVLAYNPQYTIRDGFDGRFADLHKDIKWVYEISAETTSPGCTYNIVYDNKDYDRVHAESLRSVISAEKLHEIVLPYAGHTTTFYLLEVGLLKHVTLSILSRQQLRSQDLRKDRRLSRQYVTTISGHLLRKQHFQLLSRIGSSYKSEYKPWALTSWGIQRRIFGIARACEMLEVFRLWRMGFDRQFYIHVNWDVVHTGLSPLLHYVRCGRHQARIVRFRE